VDLLYKLTAHVADLGSELAVAESVTNVYDRRAVGRLVRQLDEERKAAVEQLKHVAYFRRQVVWLQERFPKAELEAVPGLVKLVDRQEIAAADRYYEGPGGCLSGTLIVSHTREEAMDHGAPNDPSRSDSGTSLHDGVIRGIGAQ
jgi:hypothetical protein